MSGRRLVILRHGRTAWNEGGRFQGQYDEPLDETGRAQALAVAPAMAKLQPAVLVASDLSRAADTARPVAELTGLPLALDPALREIDLGRWSGLDGEQAKARFPDEWAAWEQGEDVRRGSGETYVEVADRAVGLLNPLVAEQDAGAVVVAITHGGTSRSVIGRMLGWPDRSWHSLGPLDNCEWAVLAETSRGWRLQRYGLGV